MKASAGNVFFAPLPRCPDHGGGPMRHDLARCLWRCAGWDGEGCPNTVTDEELTWHHLGAVDPEDLREFLR